jgi:hypothetical protein
VGSENSESENRRFFLFENRSKSKNHRIQVCDKNQKTNRIQVCDKKKKSKSESKQIRIKEYLVDYFKELLGFMRELTKNQLFIGWLFEATVNQHTIHWMPVITSCG